MKDVEQLDGRSTRWEEHRREKRYELVTAALRAIRHEGPNVGMSEIADKAGTSKTVYYRHFTDRAGLWEAVVERTADYIYRQIRLGDFDDVSVPDIISALSETYFDMVEKDPEIYDFVSITPSFASQESKHDAVTTLTSRIALDLAKVLQGKGYGDSAHVWSLSIIGAIWANADRWVANEREISKHEVIAEIRHIFEHGFATITPNTP